jgi:hypothetical protein
MLTFAPVRARVADVLSGDISPITQLEVHMLFTLAVILLILAVVGGIAIHPLLFLLVILALLAFLGGRRGMVP